MKAKTNKAVAKRIKITKSGKILQRHPHQNHFNAKKPRSKQLQQKGWKNFRSGKKTVQRYLPYK